MKRSTFVKWSLPIIVANGLIVGTAQVMLPSVVDMKIYCLETALSTVILSIGTTTLQNHLGEENGKYITLAIFISSLFMWLLYLIGGGKYGIFVHVLNILWACINYYRLKRH